MVVARCMSEGLVGGEAFAVDASLIVADAHRPARRRQGRGSRSGVQSRGRRISIGSRRRGLWRSDAGRAEGDFADPAARYTAAADAPGGLRLFRQRSHRRATRGDHAVEATRPLTQAGMSSDSASPGGRAWRQEEPAGPVVERTRPATKSGDAAPAGIEPRPGVGVRRRGVCPPGGVVTRRGREPAHHAASLVGSAYVYEREHQPFVLRLAMSRKWSCC